jgi:hypothetical protein
MKPIKRAAVAPQEINIKISEIETRSRYLATACSRPAAAKPSCIANNLYIIGPPATISGVLSGDFSNTPDPGNATGIMGLFEYG